MRNLQIHKKSKHKLLNDKTVQLLQPNTQVEFLYGEFAGLNGWVYDDVGKYIPGAVPVRFNHESYLKANNGDCNIPIIIGGNFDPSYLKICKNILSHHEKQTKKYGCKII